MIGMEMGEEDLIDLFGRVTRGTEVLDQMAAAIAIETSRTAIDQDELRARIDQKGVDRSLDGSCEFLLRQTRIGLARACLIQRNGGVGTRQPFGQDLVDREGMGAIGQCGDLELAECQPVIARSLGADHGRLGKALSGKEREAQTGNG
ncbi:hypothetical protein D3C71_1593110 [compost metagenome]